MKPMDIIRTAIGSHSWCGYANHERAINPYAYTDCVVAYDSNKFGVVFIIKSKRKYMAFSVTNVDVSAHWRNFQRLDLKRSISIMNGDETIVNEAQYKQMKDNILIADI